MATKPTNKELLEQVIRESITEGTHEVMALDEMHDVEISETEEKPTDGSHLVFVDDDLYRIVVEHWVKNEAGNYVKGV